MPRSHVGLWCIVIACVVVLVGMIAAPVLVYRHHREEWPFQTAFPRRVSWCGRVWERGNPDGDAPDFLQVGTTGGGGKVLSPVGPKCPDAVPVVLVVERDGSYREYGLLGGP